MENEKLFNTGDMNPDRQIVKAGEISEISFVVEEHDELRENPPKEFGTFYSLECTVGDTPSVINFSSKNLYRGLKGCLEDIRGKPVTLTGTGEGFERTYELDFL